MDKKFDEMEKNLQEIDQHFEEGQELAKKVMDDHVEKLKNSYEDSQKLLNDALNNIDVEPVDFKLNLTAEPKEEKAEPVVEETPVENIVEEEEIVEAPVTEKVEEVVDTIVEKIEDKKEEKKEEKSNIQVDEKSVKANGLELKLESMPLMDKAKRDFDKKYANTPSDDQIELKLESSAEYVKAKEEAKKQITDKEDTKMNPGYGLKEKAEDLAEKTKNVAVKTGEKVKDVASDASEKIKNSNVGQNVKETVLGDDGKLSAEDFDRMANDAVDSGVNFVNKLKNKLFGKKK